MREYMDDKIALTGIVLIAAPIGESDKRLVLLTRERGKVTVFARGARRPGNPFLAAANTFAFGTFYVKEARTAYQLVQTEIRNYFREITEDVELPAMEAIFWSLPIIMPERTMTAHRSSSCSTGHCMQCSIKNWTGN